MKSSRTEAGADLERDGVNFLVCKLSEMGSSVLLATVSCQTALSIQSWTRVHHIPTIIFPAEVCSNLQMLTDLSIVLHTDNSEYYRPTFELIEALGRKDVSFIMDESLFGNFGYTNICLNVTNCCSTCPMCFIFRRWLDGLELCRFEGFCSDALQHGRGQIFASVRSSASTHCWFLIFVNSKFSLFRSRKHTSDLYVLMGTPDSCRRFLENVVHCSQNVQFEKFLSKKKVEFQDDKTVILKISFQWVISCQVSLL